MKKKLLVIASNGGHLVQLLRLYPAFKDYTIVLASTSSDAPQSVSFNKYYEVPDSNFDQKLNLLKTCWAVLKLVLREKPEMIITTGAAPGLFAVLWMRLRFKKSIWIDSIANTETLSLAGKVAKRLTPHCYSQWESVSRKNNVRYLGAIL